MNAFGMTIVGVGFAAVFEIAYCLSARFVRFDATKGQVCEGYWATVMFLGAVLLGVSSVPPLVSLADALPLGVIAGLHMGFTDKWGLAPRRARGKDRCQASSASHVPIPDPRDRPYWGRSPGSELPKASTAPSTSKLNRAPTISYQASGRGVGKKRRCQPGSDDNAALVDHGPLEKLLETHGDLSHTFRNRHQPRQNVSRTHGNDPGRRQLPPGQQQGGPPHE